MTVSLPRAAPDTTALASVFNATAAQAEADANLLAELTSSANDYTNTNGQSWFTVSGTQPTIGGGLENYEWGLSTRKLIWINFGIEMASNTTTGGSGQGWNIRLPPGITVSSHSNPVIRDGIFGWAYCIHTNGSGIRDRYQLVPDFYYAGYFGLNYISSSGGKIDSLGANMNPWGGAWTDGDWVGGRIFVPVN